MVTRGTWGATVLGVCALFPLTEGSGVDVGAAAPAGGEVGTLVGVGCGAAVASVGAR